MKRSHFVCLFHFLANTNVLTLAVLSTFLLVGVGSAQAQTETVLYNFCSQSNCSDGGYPMSGLTFHGGNVYGTTGYNGGETSTGNVFELSPNGSGGWTETVLYSFSCTDFEDDCPDGGYAQGTMIFDSKGNLYGTTSGLSQSNHY